MSPSPPSLYPDLFRSLLFLVFTYLYEQSRQPYFRAWQFAWAAYSLHYVFDTFPASSVAFFISELFLVAMALCIFVSTRMMRGPAQFRVVRRGGRGDRRRPSAADASRTHRQWRVPARCAAGHPVGFGLAAILLYCSLVFLLNGHKRGSLAFQVLAFALALWGVLMGVGQLQNPCDGDIRKRQPVVWACAADAAGHRDGDGVV